MKKFLFIILLIIIASSVTGFYHITRRADMNYYRGYRLFVSGEYLNAIPFFEAALEFDPHGPDILEKAAYSYLWTRRPDKAIPLFKKAVIVSPGDRQLLISFADAYTWNREYDNAVRILESVLSGAKDAAIEKKLAEIYMWSEDFDKSLDILRSLEQRYPQDQDVLLLLGRTLYYSGRSLEASKVLEKLMEVFDEG